MGLGAKVCRTSDHHMRSVHTALGEARLALGLYLAGSPLLAKPLTRNLSWQRISIIQGRPAPIRGSGNLLIFGACLPWHTVWRQGNVVC